MRKRKEREKMHEKRSKEGAKRRIKASKKERESWSEWRSRLCQVNEVTEAHNEAIQ